MTPVGLPNLDRRYQKLAKKKDFLIRLNKITPWEEFRPLLEQVRQKPRKSKVGRIGIERAKANLGLRNLMFNLKRYVCLETS